MAPLLGAPVVVENQLDPNGKAVNPREQADCIARSGFETLDAPSNISSRLVVHVPIRVQVTIADCVATRAAIEQFPVSRL
jgi:hypothetical protein